MSVFWKSDIDEANHLDARYSVFTAQHAVFSTYSESQGALHTKHDSSAPLRCILFSSMREVSNQIKKNLCHVPACIMCFHVS